MPKAAPTKVKPQREYTCSHCSSTYLAKRHIKPGQPRYCSDKCRNAAKRKADAAKSPKLSAREKKIQRRMQRLTECAFGLSLIATIRRCGSYQTYQGLTAADLHELYSIHNRHKGAYGWLESGHGQDFFHKCHVHPLKAKDGSIGCSGPIDMFVFAATYNQAAGNAPCEPWAGRSIPKSQQRRKWKVKEDATREDVVNGLSELLGPELDQFLEELDAIPGRIKRLELANRIYNRQQDAETKVKLSRRYTLAELQALDIEELYYMDAKQRGKTYDPNQLWGDLQMDSALGIAYDELKRFAERLPDGQHKENCRFMLAYVRAVGIYLAQLNLHEGTSKHRFLRIPGATWHPVVQIDWQNPWEPSEDYQTVWDGGLDPATIGGMVLSTNRQKRLHADLYEFLADRVLQFSYNALAGKHVPREMLLRSLRKRLDVQGFVPSSFDWDYYSRNDVMDWDGYLVSLYASLDEHYSPFVELGLCTTADQEAARPRLLRALKVAIDQKRNSYRSNKRFHRVVQGKVRTDWNWKGFPSDLEYPECILQLHPELRSEAV